MISLGQTKTLRGKQYALKTVWNSQWKDIAFLIWFVGELLNRY